MFNKKAEKKQKIVQNAKTLPVEKTQETITQTMINIICWPVVTILPMLYLLDNKQCFKL